MGELIASGHLVPPRTFVIDVGVQDALDGVKKTRRGLRHERGRLDHEHAPVTDAVVRHWKEKAAVARPSCSAPPSPCRGRSPRLHRRGVASAVVHGEMSDGERKATLAAYENGRCHASSSMSRC
jgi:DNA repair protein RadD